ncbi:MAG: hypothetical protein HYT72_01180 [Candidatus Aenigmarchaeota archaeon]|nr:hypothetical protein [Candidatus Aenigmarchaeota archaeon]
MKIIIPMAGDSSGFDDIKPLVIIDGKTMIEHVCSMFPRKSSFIFLCRKEGMEKLESVLQKISPDCLIVPVDQTRGPADTVLQLEGRINNDEEVIISYCDAYVKWDFWKFVDEARKNSAVGVLSTFKGFNPVFLGNELHAYINVNDNDLVTEIREKGLFHPNKMENYTSAGSYYFSRWSLFVKYAKQMIEKNIGVSDNYFVSLVYNLMIKDGLRVVPYEVEDFVSWGHPENLKEYMFWSEYFSSLVGGQQERKTFAMTNLVPMAGLGKRFADAGYKKPKPLIEVLGSPMAVKSALSLPKAERYIFVCMEDHTERFGLDKLLKKNIPSAEIMPINMQTDGMARTCLMAEDRLDTDKPLLISSCDYSFVYDEQKFEQLINQGADVVIWTFRQYPDARRNPKAYAYLVVENGLVKRISEKVPISDEPHKDQIVLGIFYFKNARIFIEAARGMIEKKIAVNGEYYVATSISELINKGMKIVPFEVDKYICWGTPEDLKIFEYWKDYFSSLGNHPYDMDRRANHNQNYS